MYGNMSKITWILEKGFYIVTLILLSVLIYWRFRYGMTRYFDIDEFAHLHWSHNAFIGLRPYTDFFYFLPPLFLYTLFPLFLASGRSVGILLLSRGFSFIIFALCSLVLFLIVAKVKDKKTALFSLFIFAFLPMPLDKWIEIRPDSFSTVFSFLGIIFLILTLQKRRRRYAFLSGLFYSVAVFLLPKVIFFLFVGVMVIFIFSIRNKVYSYLYALGIGLLIPLCAVLLLYVSYGNIQKALYLTVNVVSSATAVLGRDFPREADLAFRPNGAYYGLEWYNLAWKSNLFIWVVASIWAVKHAISVFDEKNSTAIFIKFLLFASFWLNFISYVKLFPLRHPQYLIPLSPFIAYYFADCIFSLKKRFVQIIVAIVCIFIFFFAANEMYAVKLSGSNKETLAYYEKTYHFLPAIEPVFDLSGETIFYPEGYYFCCIPYGQYEEVLTFSYPNLEKELQRKQVKFIHVQSPERIGVLPFVHQKTIRQYYLPYKNSLTNSFYVAGVKVQSRYAWETLSIDLIAPGTYEFVFQGKAVDANSISALVHIDGKPVSTSPVYLTSGKHTIAFSTVGEMEIRYRW